MPEKADAPSEAPGPPGLARSSRVTFGQDNQTPDLHALWKLVLSSAAVDCVGRGRLQAFAAAHGLPEVTVVADAGMMSEANLKDLEDVKRPGLRAPSVMCAWPVGQH